MLHPATDENDPCLPKKRGQRTNMAVNATLSKLIPITLGVSGHRDIVLDDMDDLRHKVEGLLQDLSKRFPSTPLRMLTGLADGADRLVADVFLEERGRAIASGKRVAKHWKLVATLPMPASEYKADFPSSVETFDDLLASCDERMILTNAAVIGGKETDTDRRLRGYQALADYLAGQADILIALWDGIYLDRPAGTSEVVRARLAPESRLTFAQDRLEGGPVWHVPTRRQSSPTVPKTSIGSASWLTPKLMDTSQATFDEGLQRIDALNWTIWKELGGPDGKPCTLP